MLGPPSKRVDPQLAVLRSPKVQAVEIPLDILDRQVAPNVVPLRVPEDSTDDPGLLSRRSLAHEASHFLFADVVVPRE